MTQSFKNIKGGQELFAMLQTLPVKLEKNILRGAMRAGAKVIATEAKNNAPVKSGELLGSIKIGTKSKKGQVIASVKVGNKKVWYSHFIEFGTAAHTITAKKGALSFGGFVGKSVEHTGIRAKPFMRPALDAKSNQAIQEAGNYIAKRLTKEGLNAPSIEVDDFE